MVLGGVSWAPSMISWLFLGFWSSDFAKDCLLNGPGHEQPWSRLTWSRVSLISWLFWRSGVLSAWLPLLAVMWGDRVTLASFYFSICLAFLSCFCVYLWRTLLYSLSFASVCVCWWRQRIWSCTLHRLIQRCSVGVSSLFMWGRSVYRQPLGLT